MNKELEETVLKVADYSNEEKKLFSKRLSRLFLVGILALVAYMVLDTMEMADIYDGFVSAGLLGWTFGMMIVGFLYTTGWLLKVKILKRRLLQKSSRKHS